MERKRMRMILLGMLIAGCLLTSGCRADDGNADADVPVSSETVEETVSADVGEVCMGIFSEMYPWAEIRGSVLTDVDGDGTEDMIVLYDSPATDETNMAALVLTEPEWLASILCFAVTDADSEYRFRFSDNLRPTATERGVSFLMDESVQDMTVQYTLTYETNVAEHSVSVKIETEPYTTE